jgi:hypothetical protein
MSTVEETGRRCPHCHKLMTVERDQDGADQACLSCGHAEAGAPPGRSWTKAEIRKRHARVKRDLYGVDQGVQLPIVWDDTDDVGNAAELVSVSGSVSVNWNGVEWTALSPGCYRCEQPSYEDCVCDLMPDRRPQEVAR